MYKGEVAVTNLITLTSETVLEMLEALEASRSEDFARDVARRRAIKTLRTALAQQEQNLTPMDRVEFVA